MITEQHREEHLSRAYVHAVTAKAGHIFEPPISDYGVDGTLHQVENRNGRRDRSGFSIDLQAKATINWFIRDGNVIYDLEAKTYNDLVARFKRRRATPMILVVLCLPKEEAEWLTLSADQMTLKHCCYWCQFAGEFTDNEQRIRIEIPQGNVLTPDTVARLLALVEAGEALS